MCNSGDHRIKGKSLSTRLIFLRIPIPSMTLKGDVPLSCSTKLNRLSVREDPFMGVTLNVRSSGGVFLLLTYLGFSSL